MEPNDGHRPNSNEKPNEEGSEQREICSAIDRAKVRGSGVAPVPGEKSLSKSDDNELNATQRKNIRRRWANLIHLQKMRRQNARRFVHHRA